MNPEDTRKRVRILFDDDAVITTKDKTFNSMKCKDISLNGTYIYCDNSQFEINELVEILFSIQLGQTSLSLEVKGAVVRKGDNGIGINFREMSPQTFQHLANYIAMHVGDKDRFKRELQEKPEFEP
jgi:hypothetical protein